MSRRCYELPVFERHRGEYLSDEAFTMLQATLIKSPEAGDLIVETGGLRKLRFADLRRGKGKRGGLRGIYCWWQGGSQFWLYTLYDKDERDDLAPEQRKNLKSMLKAELEARRKA
ncbi:MAG: toxin [Casimicrobiaceae bacterium]